MRAKILGSILILLIIGSPIFFLVDEYKNKNGEHCDKNYYTNKKECAQYNLAKFAFLEITSFLNHNEGTVVGGATIFLALITGFLAFFTRGLMMYTRKLWGATSDIVDDAKDTSKKELRAYLVIKEAALKSLDEPLCEVEFINAGKTPAYHVTIWHGGAMRPYPVIDKVKIDDMKRPPVESKATLGPNRTAKSHFKFPDLSEMQRVALGTKRAVLL